MKERIDALEAQIHDMFKSDQDAPGILKQFSFRLDTLEVNLEATDNTRYAESMEWEGKFKELQDRVEHHARHSEGIDWESKFQELQDRVELLSRTVVNTPAGGAEHSSRPRVPEPKSYGGARDAKELENFLFDIEQYFRAIRVDSEATKVSMAAMYLVGDAKLWWRKKYAEIEDGSCVINTWEILKRELKSQFFLENTAFNTRKALLECKHTRSVREYCQAFSALMLDISDMSAVDRLFFFMEGLNHGLVPSLIDVGWTTLMKPSSLSRAFQITTPSHRDPLREEIQAKVQRGEQSGSRPRHPPTDEQTDTQDYEEEDAVGAFPQWCNAVTAHIGNPKKSLTGEEPKDMPPKKKGDVPGKGLMYVDIKVNGKAIRAMVDTRATHNYISSTEVERLGLTLEKGCGRWQELLAEFNFMLEYRTGSTNSVADALSRRAELDQGMPQDIVSDRDSRFTGNFWSELFKLFGSQLSMSSSYHPESDGQTERFNSMLEEYLRHFVSATQKNWVKLLDVAQLKSPRAISFNEEWRQNIDLAHSYLEKAARRMTKHADKNRRSQEFNVGDKVMVKLLPQDRKFLRGRDSRLLQKYEGPLTIVKKIGKMAYKVDPPHWWSRQLHPVFHVNMLKPFYEDTADPSRGQINRQ
ncbi:hypothetical protein RJ639_034920 [Escallonia herrerae]|uniref:Integrase catalytic domain-containing protein n=1 Tax=Escallonia herrerae TaxID=1293975 RepID=A0AA89B7F8_9ASTE|nr:hypothetical protein RJ639_034920 [Escallonia herrerae]